MIFFLRLCQLFAGVYKNCKISCSSQYVLVGLTFHIFRLVFAGEPVSILHQQPFFAVQLILARSPLLSQQTKEAALTSKNSTSQHDSVRIFWITPKDYDRIFLILLKMDGYAILASRHNVIVSNVQLFLHVITQSLCVYKIDSIHHDPPNFQCRDRF